MKPARFDYVAPRSLDHALSVLGAESDAARVLAGGQSLGPLLNLRLARPKVLVDVNQLRDLDQLRIADDGSLAIGATTRQRSVEVSADVAARWGLLSAAVSDIGHRAIRNRGTIGGSVAHADPAAELPAALIALDARFHVASSSGSRSLAASEFFTGPFTTTLEPDEMLTGVTVPPPRGDTGQAWIEFSRRQGDFAVIGVAAVLRLDSAGRCSALRLVYSGADWMPWQPASVTEQIRGRDPSTQLFEDVGRAVASESSPPDDVHASAAHRRRLIRVLTARALSRCAREAVELQRGA